MAPCNQMVSRERSSRVLFGLILSAILAAVSPARAEDYCISTPSELTDALLFSQFTPGSNSLRLRPGTYNLPNGVSYENAFGGDLFLSGDWNSGCTVRGSDPYATVIDGFGAESSTWVFIATSTDITIQQIRFSNVEEVRMVDYVANGCTPSGQKFVVRRSIFDGSSSSLRLAIGNLCHAVILENNLVRGGRGVMQFGDDGNPPPLRMVHNTITGSVEKGLYLGRLVEEGSFIELYNNIIYGNAGDDVFVENASSVLAIGNNWGEINFDGSGGLSPGSSNNVTTNPQLQADGRPAEPGSPAINTGSNSVPGGLPSTDIEGNSRVIGSAPDRGAFETDISNIAVLSVTDPNDSGPGTLRQAIITANASPNAQIITFNIPGSCPQSIFLQSPLPSLTDDGLLLINGQTQPGSSANTLVDGNNATICIQLRKSSQVGSLSHAIKVPAGSDTFLILRGIGFGGFGNAIELADGDGHLIQGNRFGEPLPSNSIGVYSGPGSKGAKIGGISSPALRNTIANSSFAGIFIDGSDNVEIGNNYIGTDPNGLAAAPNNVGVFVQNGVGTQIFSSVISGNTLSGVLISGAQTSDTIITDNNIGVSRNTASGTFPRGNGTAGVIIGAGAHDSRIGGTLRDTGNIIAANGGDGVAVQSGQRNTIIGNRIYSNGELGIDLAANGVNQNDNDADSVPADYANRGVNFPALSSAIGGDASGSVRGTLSSTRGEYRIEFFMNTSCDASGHGEGATSIGALQLTLPNLPGQQTQAFAATVQIASASLGGWISATATDSSGNTSEFSACVPYDSSDLIFADDFD
ncbi:choice-of-anchor Q domain-containing protein [Dokdonella sp.]|uniref:choice-of-anchor Q domain-containing protein n=1 Tax=Dokdonella sp. TaxID=2291710 RepID=UPI003C4A01CB